MKSQRVISVVLSLAVFAVNSCINTVVNAQSVYGPTAYTAWGTGQANQMRIASANRLWGNQSQPNGSIYRSGAGYGPTRIAAAPTQLRALNHETFTQPQAAAPTQMEPSPQLGNGGPFERAYEPVGPCTGCAGCPCVSCCRCFCWMVTVDALALNRSDPPSNPIIVNETTQVRMFDAQQLDMGYEIGPRVRILRDGGPGCCAWEVGYFGIYSWNSSATVTGDVRFVGPGFLIAVNPGSFTLDYDSSLQSGEVNFRPGRGNPWGWFLGIRYINLDEAFSVRENNTPLPNVLQIDTNNNLYGGQIGTQFIMLGIGSPLRLQGRITGGIYYNDASQGTSSAIVGPGVSASSDDLAFVGEAEVSIVYQLTPRLAIRGGYQIMGISGVALAPDQIHSTALNISEASVRLGSLWADGAHLGFTFMW